MAALAVVVVAVGALIFQPWLLFVDTEVDDEIPVAVTTSPSAAPAGPVVIAAGTFIGHEHDTTGRVTVIERPDGARLLAIENLETTTGPDVNVWLSAAPVIPGVRGWRSAAGADHVDLGDIKGNRGDQVYPIPPGVDLARYRAVVLWCVRFSVSFGAAELEPPESPVDPVRGR
ncbi:hypothetical protein D7316_05372 [Gordonia insulae]|uniref:DM13 domain-containing protein n=1 Tax=Gordonia insulae TaxID=2420509 RepID=A0A3G8JUB0_9ACTN|nr:DM13 domain-containing protein [Gordonia insulae]AZG48751.1 hypothetical protein D7316_05372 [Gordonia insulae]